MKHIRPFVRDDIPQVADLHRRAFVIGGKAAQQPISPKLLQSYNDYFEDIYFGNPWYDESLPSLVYQKETGEIIGFLGVMPRRMSFNGRLINVAISSQLVVEPDKSSMGAGVWLSKFFLSGPQDLSLTDEANNLSRKLWEGLGGDTALLFSIQWTRLLRPGSYAISLAERAGLLPRLSWAMRPVGTLVDTIAVRKLPRHFTQPIPQVSAEDLGMETFLMCLSEFSSARSLWPEYDYHSLKWLLEMLARKNPLGTLRKSILRSAREEIIGWYLYLLNPGGISTVVQIVAREGSFGKALDHLLYDASQQGSIAVSGQIEPKFVQEFSERRCLFDCGKPWVLIHSHDPSLREAIHHGNALISKLEGELCMRFHS